MIADLYKRVGLRVPLRFVRVAPPPAGLRQLAEYEAAHGLPDPVFVPSTGWQGDRPVDIGASISFRDDWAATLT